MTRSKHHYWYWDEVPCLSSGGAQSPWTRVRASCWRSTKWNGLVRWMLEYVFSKSKSWTFPDLSCRWGGGDPAALRPSLPLRALLSVHQETLLFCFDFFDLFLRECPCIRSSCEVFIFLSIRSHFVANRLRDLMFGEPVPRTPCPICRFTNSS